MVKEYIERGALEKVLCEKRDKIHRDVSNRYYNGYREGLDVAFSLSLDLPAADVVAVKHGRWELYGNDDDCGKSYFCSVCGANYDEDWFYTHGEYTPFEHCQGV